jgi:hypothetical protein
VLKFPTSIWSLNGDLAAETRVSIVLIQSWFPKDTLRICKQVETNA